MVNTILAKRVNHIVAKRDNPAWPKGSKSRGFSIRERNMLMNAKRKERTLVYKYDERGNIVKMIYRYGENMRKHRVDMEKDLFTISIEYVE